MVSILLKFTSFSYRNIGRLIDKHRVSYRVSLIGFKVDISLSLLTSVKKSIKTTYFL